LAIQDERGLEPTSAGIAAYGGKKPETGLACTHAAGTSASISPFGSDDAVNSEDVASFREGDHTAAEHDQVATSEHSSKTVTRPAGLRRRSLAGGLEARRRAPLKFV